MSSRNQKEICKFLVLYTYISEGIYSSNFFRKEVINWIVLIGALMKWIELSRFRMLPTLHISIMFLESRPQGSKSWEEFVLLLLCLEMVQDLHISFG